MHKILKSDLVKIILITVVMLLLAVILLGVKVFFVKGGKFPHTHIDGNKELNRRGITCVRHDKDFK